MLSRKILIGSALILACLSVQASDGLITFNGLIVNPTMSISNPYILSVEKYKNAQVTYEAIPSQDGTEQGIFTITYK